MLQLKKMLQRPIAAWPLLFLLTTFLWRGEGATNEASRIATLRAMTDRATFRIDPIKDWTIDWSQTPDGAYYSNKAPGPMLVGAPLFWLMEQFTEQSDVYRYRLYQDQEIRTDYPTPIMRHLFSSIMQAIPYAILCFLILLTLEQVGIPIAGQHFAALAMLFGQTATIFMNVYFGHGMAALFVTGAFYFFYRRQWAGLGFCLGMAMLSEYTLALYLMLFSVALLWIYRRQWQWIKPFVLGGVFPGVLWCWYHISACGSPFKITAQFQNPMWQNMKHEENNLWGLFALKLNWPVVFELLFGVKRGLLVTQPWVLLALLLFLILPWLPKSPESAPAQTPYMSLRSMRWLIGIAFLTLFFVNTTFGGWHGGLTSGPRYLAPILPAMAFALALHWNVLPRWSKWLLWPALAMAVAFKIMTVGGTILSDLYPLWPYLWWLTKQWPGQAGVMRLVWFSSLLVLTGLAIFLQDQRRRKKSSTGH